MKNAQKIDLGLTGYDELFMNEAERKENKLPRIYDIPISEIDDFPDHPFKVKIDEDMDQLVQSIKERGIITPVTLRPKEDGRYEIVSGHRRKKACELAGFETVKAEVREMTRDEAIILMVESNLQRSTILPSEKAFSYKMRLEAMKRQQGERTDLTSVPVGQKLSSREILAENSPDSNTQIQRYIRLPVDAFIPYFNLVVDGFEHSRKIKAVKKSLCNQNGITYCEINSKDPFAMAAQIKALFRKNHVYITSENENDIRFCRNLFFSVKRKNARTS